MLTGHSSFLELTRLLFLSPETWSHKEGQKLGNSYRDHPTAVGVRFRILDLFFRTGSRLEDRSNVAFVWRRHAKFEMLAIFVGHGAISSKACTVHGGPSSWCGTYWSRKAGWAGGFCLLYQFTKADSEFVMLCIEQLRAETPWLSSALRTSSSVSLLGHPTHPVLEFSELSSKKNKN